MAEEQRKQERLLAKKRQEEDNKVSKTLLLRFLFYLCQNKSTTNNLSTELSLCLYHRHVWPDLKRSVVFKGPKIDGNKKRKPSVYRPWTNPVAQWTN